MEYFIEFSTIFLVNECKALYKSIQDSLRYKRKKIAGKSGDSGDEMHVDETSNDSNDYLAFLTPTSSKFPRKTLVMGAANSKQSPDNPDLDELYGTSLLNHFDQDDTSQTSASTVYSYVSIVNTYN